MRSGCFDKTREVVITQREHNRKVDRLLFPLQSTVSRFCDRIESLQRRISKSLMSSVIASFGIDFLGVAASGISRGRARDMEGTGRLSEAFWFLACRNIRRRPSEGHGTKMRLCM